MKEIFKSSYRNIFILSLFVFIVTAYFSEGYHHPDEHFQIFEFANYKLGNSLSTDLPWEFNAQSRQAFPAYIAFIIVKILYSIKISNPFFIAFILRLLIAFSAWFIISKLCLKLIENFKTENGKKLFVAMSMLMWFAPYLYVRFSSENIAGTLLLYSIYFLIELHGLLANKKMFSLLGAGLLLGFAFFFRFQIGFAIAGIGFWLIIINKMKWKNILLLLFGSSISAFACIYSDYWFYGKWLLSPVNYFETQIVHDVVSNWGVSPWWYYLKLFFIQGIPPVSLFLLIFFFIGLFKNLKSVFTWCIIPFLLAHFIVGHKEMRFLFPMLFTFIYLSALGIDNFIAKRKYLILGRFMLTLSLIINIPVLIFRMLIPAQEAVSYYKFLYNYSNKKEITLLCNEKNIYELVGYNVNFYKSKNVKCIVLHGDQEFSKYLTEHKPDSIFMFDTKLIPENKFSEYKNESIFCLFPKWLLRFNINNWESRSRIWDIHKLKKM